jgi:hypothetical protein
MPPSRTRLLAAAALAAALVPAAASSAAEVAPVARTAHLAAGPAISGDRVAYGTAGSAFSVFGGPIGTRPAQLFSATARHRNGELQGVDVALSPTRTAFAFGEFLPVDPDGATAYQRAFAGGPAGPFAAVAGDADGRAVVDSLDVSGDALLTTERTSSAIRAYVRDLAAGTPARQIGGDGVREARIAGDVVAYGEPRGDAQARVHVVNWRTGAELFHVDAPVTAPYSFGFGLDVQTDGTVAIRTANPASTGSKPKVDIAWASPAAPTLHVVATDVGPDVTRISGGRILFERAHGAHGRELALAGLDGTVRAASFPLAYVDGADLDGSRIAFASNGCVYAGDVPAAAPATAPAGTCPQASLELTTARSTTRGRVKVTVTCVMAAARGCEGDVVLRTPRAKHRKVLVLATRKYRVDADRATTFNVTMSSSRLRSLRRRVGQSRRTAIVDVRASATDGAGLTATTYRDALVRLR